MRILIVRHGDPDYSVDGLTEKGRREVELLARRLAGEDIAAIYTSPLGRARLTAAPTEAALGLKAEVCTWLQEFPALIKVPYLDEKKCAWDLLPSFAEKNPELYSLRGWRNVDFIKAGGIADAYDGVCAEFDALLARHGYKREGFGYRVTDSNHDTVALFCHFGLGAVLTSRLMNCSPYSVWQHGVMLTSSVTTFFSEEREEGIAHFRMSSFGDLYHLAAAGDEPSFSARFCECFTDDTRH